MQAAPTDIQASPPNENIYTNTNTENTYNNIKLLIHATKLRCYRSARTSTHPPSKTALVSVH